MEQKKRQSGLLVNSQFDFKFMRYVPGQTIKFKIGDEEDHNCFYHPEDSMKTKDSELFNRLAGTSLTDRHVFMSEGGMYLYHVGIIDYL